MDKFDIDNVLQIVELSNELEFEKASALQLKLRWMQKEDESLSPIREHLRLLVRDYKTNTGQILIRLLMNKLMSILRLSG